MNKRPDDLLRVPRVQVVRQGRLHEILGCWISVEPDDAEVGIWLSPEEKAPLLTIPLDQAIIEWPAPQVEM